MNTKKCTAKENLPPPARGGTGRALAGALFPAAVLLAGALLAGRTEAAAAKRMDLTLTTPAIQKIRKSMAVRAKALRRWKDLGYLGEGRDGLLAVRTREGLKLSEKKRLADRVAAENAERRALYRELLKANGLRESAENAERLMKRAARARRAKAAPGHWVQRPGDGRWAKARDVKK